MSLNKKLMDECWIKAIKSSTETEAYDYSITYRELIIAKYDRNISYALEDQLNQIRLKGL